MNARYRIIYRSIRGGIFYCVDKKTGKRHSLHTRNADEAQQIVEAKNNSERQPVLKLQIARAYLTGSDNGINTRTWEHTIEALTSTKDGAQPASLENRRQGQGIRSVAAANHHRDARRIAAEGSQHEHGVQECLSAPIAQLLRGHELAAWPLIPKRQCVAV